MKIKKMLDEEDLHELFFQHPHLLIGVNETIVEKQHEFMIDKDSIADLYIRTDTSEYVVEIKDRRIKRRDVMQALRYKLKLRGRKNLKVLIVGCSVSHDAFEYAKQQNIYVRIIGTDIPLLLSICNYCRKAYDARRPKCPYCSCTRRLAIIDLRNLQSF